jgi:hypothetical protein
MPLLTKAGFRQRFLRRLNRDDCPNDLADEFIEEGITRIQREVRAPFQEHVQYVDATETTGPVESILLPEDYLELVSILVARKPLRRKPVPALFEEPTQGPPRWFGRYGNTMFLRGPCPVGSRIELLYYRSFTGLAGENDTNELLTVAPDLLLYSALVPAGNHFHHEKTGEWEAFYTDRREALNAQALRDELSGDQAVAPMYSDPGTD